MRQHSGFTLVELLVVVSIVGLLISILLPSLSKGRELARRTVCLSHIRGLNNSWEIYSSTHRYPPPLTHRYTGRDPAPDGIDINYKLIRSPPPSRWTQIAVIGFGPETWDDLNINGQQWLTIYHRNTIFHWSMPQRVGAWRNFGLLWQSGVVDDPRVFFCPSERDPDLSWNTPYNPWPPTEEQAGQPDNPRIANHTESSFERRGALTGVLWDRIGNDVAIVSDTLWPDNVKARHRDGVNVAGRDGHAEFVRNQRLTGWWADNDAWNRSESRLKFLQMSHWLDRQSSR